MAIYTVALDFFKMLFGYSVRVNVTALVSEIFLMFYIDSLTAKKRKENRSKKKHQELINKDLGQLVENYLVL